MALFAPDEEERAVELAGGFKVAQEAFQSGVGGVEGGFETGVWGTAGVEVACVLLSPGYGLEVGADETWSSAWVLGAVRPVAGGPVLKG